MHAATKSRQAMLGCCSNIKQARGWECMTTLYIFSGGHQVVTLTFHRSVSSC